MAGTPERRALARRIEERGGADWFFDQLPELGIKGMAALMDCSATLLYRWRNESDERRQQWAEALAIEGDVRHLSKAGEHMDRLATMDDPTSAQVQQAKELGAFHIAMARLKNPDYAEKQAQGAVNIANLHLYALQQPVTQREILQAIPEAVLIESGE